jgi:hypothetical protein
MEEKNLKSSVRCFSCSSTFCACDILLLREVHHFKVDSYKRLEQAEESLLERHNHFLAWRNRREFDSTSQCRETSLH